MLRFEKPIRHILVTLSILLIAVVSISNSQAAERINTLDKKGLWGFKETGIAIRGYDTVAYFTLNKAVKGTEAFSVEWSGATWHFSTQEHADLFEENPTDYAPQYGGYCAYGVAGDYLVKIEPDQWRIENGKLYLNYNQSVQNTWLEDIGGYIKKADSKFEKLLADS